MTFVKAFTIIETSPCSLSRRFLFALASYAQRVNCLFSICEDCVMIGLHAEVCMGVQDCVLVTKTSC